MCSSAPFFSRTALTAALCVSSTVLARPKPPSAAPPAPVAPAASVAASGLNSEQVYTILVGELARQRGDLTTAFTNYLHAAQLTQAPKMAELAVQMALNDDDYVGAETAMRLWLKMTPQSRAAHQIAALLRIHANDQEGAVLHLVRMVELTEGADASVYDAAAAVASRAPKPELQLRLMQALVDRFPASADAQQALATLAANVSDFALAERSTRRALELRADWNKARLFLVRVLLSQQKRAEARQLLEGFVQRSPDDQALRMLYGQFLVEEKEFSAAREVFTQLLVAQPQYGDALFAAAILSLQLNDLDGAKQYFTRLFESGERQDEAAFYLGQTAEQAQDATAALRWYAEVDDAHVVEAHMRMAVLRADRGEIAPAREILQRLRRSLPDDAADVIKLTLLEAELLEDAGQKEEALRVFNAALTAAPTDQDLLYGRALLAAELEQVPMAEQDLRRIFAEDAENANALNALGYILTEHTTRYEEARGYIERANALKPNQPAILDSLGWVNYRLGKLELARKYLQQAFAEFNDGEVAAHLGEVLWALNQRAEAEALWAEALKTHPNHAYLMETVQRHRVVKTEVAPKTGKAKVTQ
jgi:tetratricopeptide (TPR) repeat protein